MIASTTIKAEAAIQYAVRRSPRKPHTSVALPHPNGKDHSRSIIARNASPDIGFDASINPYRGCSHGCVYCMSGDTPILMANETTRRLQRVRVGDEVYGTVRSEEHTSELQSRQYLVCRLLLEKKSLGKRATAAAR